MRAELRSEGRSVPVNFLMNFLLKLSGALFSAVSYPYAFRVLGGESIGKVAFSASVTGLFVMLASMGIPTYGIRECARVREDRDKLRKTMSELLKLQLLTTLAAEILLFAAVAAVPRLRAEWPLFLVQGGMLLFHGLDSEWLFAALERYDFLALRSFCAKLLSLVLVFGFVRSPGDYLLYAVFTAAPTILGNAWNIWSALRCLDGIEKAEWSDVGRHIRTSLVFFTQAAAVTVYTNLDAALLGFFHTDAVVGDYDAAVKIKLVLTFFITSLGTVLLPRFSLYAAERRESELARGARLSAGFVLLASLPLTVFFLFLAPECLRTLYGAAAEDTLASLRILMPTLVLIGCSNLTGIQLLTPLGRERTVMWSALAGAAVDLAADLLLIPRWGGPGAALGTLLAELAVLLVQLRGMRTLRMNPFQKSDCITVTLASLSAAPVLRLICGRVDGPPQRVLLCGAAYFGLVCGILLLCGNPTLKFALARAGEMWKTMRQSFAGTRSEKSGREGAEALAKKSVFWQAYLFIALCALGFMICCGANSSFWFDEFAQICYSGLNKTLAESALQPDPTPPLFNVAANIWYRLVPYGDRWLLLLPQLATAAAVFLMGLWGESWGGRGAGIWSACFLGFSQSVLEQCGFEFRAYGFYLFFSVAVFCLHWQRMREEGRCSAVYALSLAALMYSHLFGCLIVLSVGVWDLALRIRRQKPWRMLAPYFVSVGLFVPWIVFFLTHVAPQAVGTPSIWMAKPGPWELVKLGAYLCGNHIVLCLLCLAGARGVCADAYTAKRPSSEQAERLLPLFVMLTNTALVYLYGAIRSEYASLWVKRYFTGLFPCAAVLCGYGAADILRRLRRTEKGKAAAALTGALLFLATVPVFLFRTARQDTPLAVYHHREAADTLCMQPDIHDENVLVLSTLDEYTEGWEVYYGEKQGRRPGFLAKGVYAVTPEELSGYDVVYYEHGFWPERAEQREAVKALRSGYVPEKRWDGIALERYVKKD